LAKIYKDELSEFDFQKIPNYVSCHPFMLFALLVPKKQRNSLNNHLQKNGVETRICWLPVHKQPFHSKLFNEKLKNSEEIYSKIINLPMGNGLSANEVSHVCNVFKTGLKSIL
jgi:dTDP-4-amino-4,6-dideoxygalactose transaminase